MRLNSESSHSLGNTIPKLKLIEDALQGDMVAVISPATVDLVATAAGWTRTVVVTLKNAAGAVHNWCNMPLATIVAIADTSSAGEASIGSTTLTFVNGIATIEITGDAAAFIADETDTLTIASMLIFGYTITGGTSVQTIVAAE